MLHVQDKDTNNGSRLAKLALSSTSISPVITSSLRTAITIRRPLRRRLRIRARLRVLVTAIRRPLRLALRNIRRKTNPSTSPENRIEDIDTGKGVNVSEAAGARPHRYGD
jgi:tRNA(Phe) wybutosine-synthesizing methylase Tyw3